MQSAQRPISIGQKTYFCHVKINGTALDEKGRKFGLEKDREEHAYGFESIRPQVIA
jgi:hypothetical protein